MQSMWGNASAMPLAIVPSLPRHQRIHPIKDAFTFAYNQLTSQYAITRHGFIKEIVESWFLASVLPKCPFMGNTKCGDFIISEPSAQAIPWFCQNWIKLHKHKRSNAQGVILEKETTRMGKGIDFWVVIYTINILLEKKPECTRIRIRR